MGWSDWARVQTGYLRRWWNLFRGRNEDGGGGSSW